LILEAVHIEDGAGNDIGGKYTFEYNTTPLPNRLSYDQDFWGYANNAGNNLKFVPTTTLQTANSGSPVVVAGADRFISPLNAQAGMITRINYPTGGSTVFNFESNWIRTAENKRTTRYEGYVSVGTHISDGVGVYYSPYFILGDCIVGNDEDYEVTCQLTANNNCGNGQANLQCPQISIEGITDEGDLFYAPANFSAQISIPAGEYRLKIDVSFIDPELAATAYAEIYFPLCEPIVNNITYHNVAVGGQRIKNIINFNETGKISGTKAYDYTDKETGHPTGRAISLPEYISELEEIRQQVQADGSTTFYNCKFISISSGSNYPLASTKGSATGYSYVREFTGANGELGMTEFFYTTPESNPDIINPQFPYAPYTSHDWQRGQLVKQIKSKRLNGSGTPAQFRKVEEQVIEYEEKALTGLKGIKTGQRYFPLGSGGTNPPRPIEHVTYDVHTGWYVPTMQTTITYDENDEARKVMSATSIIYNATNLQQQQSSSTVNNSRQLVKRTLYPVDYTVVANAQHSENLGLKTLLQNNMLTVPVEQYTTRKDANGDEFVVGGTITTFKPDRPLPYQIYGLELTAPVPISSFTPSYLDAAGQFVKDSRYKQQVDFAAYDESGNILQQKKVRDLPISYVWGYNSTYPIAEARNAIASQIFYTSFEGGSTGNWALNGNVLTTGGITGKNSFNGTLTATIPIETDFILTAWTKDNANISVYGGGAGTVLATRGQWKLMQWILNNNGDVQITGDNLDEVRLYPKKALMTTYTYDPVIGVTGQCDASNKISYYEYDSFGRLKLIRDQDGYILKTFDYKYQQQQ
jgi:YD repeat-containing protein